MSRKIKLINNFNEAAVLEIEFAPNKWARVTTNHFRSFTGSRRINGEEYTGPVFYEGTNYKYKLKKQDNARIVGVEELNNKLRKKLQPKKLDMIRVGVNSRI